MTKIALVGCGKIGAMVARLLIDSGDYNVTAIDATPEPLERLRASESLHTVCLDVTDKVALCEALQGHFAVLCASPFYLTEQVASAAKSVNAHYLDLTEDVHSTQKVRALAEGATRAFIPQCGLAPGFISIVAHSMCDKFDELDNVRLRVGALPRYPTNSLTYNLTWSTDGLINEYCESCESIINGEMVTMPALTQRREFSLEGIQYESFNTSGGLGSLAETLASKVNNLSYQTIRYPGHWEIMQTLLRDLRLSERRDLLKDILEHAIPATNQDMVLIFATVSGHRDGQLMQDTYVNKVYGREINGEACSAIQITTASALCAMLDLLHEGKLPTTGLVRQEQVSLETFLNNRFGRNYVQEKTHAEV
jgi:saccharopine dehydrogenase-like NADP-dependent oxidoreductase